MKIGESPGLLKRKNGLFSTPNFLFRVKNFKRRKDRKEKGENFRTIQTKSRNPQKPRNGEINLS